MNTPVNAVPQGAYYGKPVFHKRASQIDGATLSTGGMPYEGRDGKCKANGDTCEGFAIKGSEFCVGHTRGKAKAAVKEKVE